jgi:hypothetical protein
VVIALGRPLAPRQRFFFGHCELRPEETCEMPIRVNCDGLLIVHKQFNKNRMSEIQRARFN